MVKEFTAYCTENHLIQENENIVAGISGGADSMCLLFLLHRIQPKLHLNLVVVHVNHGIRPEAKQDALYVEEMCRKWDIPFFLYEVDAKDYAEQHSMSEEEAGRELRYQAFSETLEKYFQGEGKIAVAHNRNDRAETVLFHLFRGTGLRGLSGIGMTRDNIIRPILNLDREDIEAYLRKNEISYCIDATNAEDTYTRNRIRKHVLGYAQSFICKKAVSHIDEAANLMEETEHYLQKQTDKLFDKSVTTIMDEEGNTSGYLISAELIKTEEPLLVRYLLMRCISLLTNHAKDITSGHIRDIAKLFPGQVGRKISLPYSLQAIRGYEEVKIERLSHLEAAMQGQMEPIEIKKETIQKSGAIELQTKDRRIINMKLIPNNPGSRIPESEDTKWFDFDRIGEVLSLRNRKKGDYLTVGTEEVHKSLKKYMIDEKIPKEERDSKLLLTDNDHVLWLYGHRISQHYKVSSDTTRILEVHITGG